MLKILAIIIVAVMAFSMIAAGFLYVGDNSGTDNSNVNTLPTPNATSFTYDVSFEGSALKELGNIKLATYTTESDKTAIDSAVLKVDGVLKVSSQFKKTAIDANDWLYIAEISLKKTAQPATVALAVFDVNYFDQSKRSEFFAVKYITVSAPASVILHNTDLNIDKNFSFESATLTALGGMTTSPGDELLISGTVTIAGSTVTALTLAEELNKTQQPIFDTNSIVIDTNSLSTQDANSEVVIDANN